LRGINEQSSLKPQSQVKTQGNGEVEAPRRRCDIEYENRSLPPGRIQSATLGAVRYPPMVSPNRDPSDEEKLGIDKRQKMVLRPETQLEQTHHHP